MLLINSDCKLFEVPDESLISLRLSDWRGRKEEILTVIRGLKTTLDGMEEFQDDNIQGISVGCCSCASGQAAVMNFCKHDR